MTATDRSALIADVKQAEGFRAEAYQDTRGVWTIGYGTNLQELTIEEPLAETWLLGQLQQAEIDAQRFTFFATASPFRQRALVELIYNLGLSRLLGFVKFLKAMSDRDYETARQELLNSRWAEQVKHTRAHRIAEMIRIG